jgi:sarcosine oxidase subunit alpha
VRECHVAGAPARVLRVGFVGERGYEIHVPADRALAVWQALFIQGHDAGLAPFGVEAQRVLRLEKGHVIVGQDTDGVTNIYEAGLGAMVKDDKPFFVGQRSLAALRRRGTRQQLVGFQLDERGPVLGVICDPRQPDRRPRHQRHSFVHAGPTIGLAYVSPRSRQWERACNSWR